MKKSIYIAFIAAAFFASCGGNTAETGDAQDVKENNSAEAVEYSSLEAGSHITWRATHFGGLAPRFGKVNAVKATVKTLDNKVTNATITMDMASLTVESFDEGDPQNDTLAAHLKEGYLFNVSSYPTSAFELTAIEEATGDYNSKVTGNLTIMDSTKSITFNTNITVSEESVVVKSEKFSIDRTLWGLNYNLEGTEGLPTKYVIANPIEFSINATINK